MLDLNSYHFISFWGKLPLILLYSSLFLLLELILWVINLGEKKAISMVTKLKHLYVLLKWEQHLQIHWPLRWLPRRMKGHLKKFLTMKCLSRSHCPLSRSLISILGLIRFQSWCFVPFISNHIHSLVSYWSPLTLAIPWSVENFINKWYEEHIISLFVVNAIFPYSNIIGQWDVYYIEFHHHSPLLWVFTHYNKLGYYTLWYYYDLCKWV